MLLSLLLAVAAQDALATKPAITGADAIHHARVETAVMGMELIIEAWHVNSTVAQESVAAAEKEIRRVEDVMTDWRASPLETLNAAAGEGPQRVPKELAHLIARSLEFSDISEGAFDITFGAVGRLWDFKAEPPLVPDEIGLRAALEHVGWRRVRVNLEKSTVDLPAGMRIGLGGVAKGYGVDRAMAVLLKYGIKHGLVNAGGDLKALGRDLKKSKTTPPLWEIII